MPVSFNSPPRNFFLLGSGAQQALTNFFHTVNRASGSDRFTASDIAYSDTDQKYILAGSAKDSNSVSFGWLEKQAYDAETDPANPVNVEDWRQLFNSPATSTSTTLNFMKQTASYGGNIIIGGKTGNVPWISEYNASGVQQWVSTSQSASVEYFGVACTTNAYYACGHKTGLGIDAVAFIEKWDVNGNPLWGKSAIHLNGSVKANAVAANDRGEVVVVGSVTDQAYVQGYLAKVDTNTGDILWDRTINSGRSPSLGFRNDVEVKNVYIDGNDQIYIIGTEFADTFPVYKKGFIIKYSAEGNLIWHKTTPADENHDFLDLWSDTPVEQTVVLSRETFPANGNDILSLIKYSKNGDIVFRRRITPTTNFVQPVAGLDGDPSFYYMIFVPEVDNATAGSSKNYIFGKVSASGNGFGAFTYETAYEQSGVPREIDYTVNTNTPNNPIGRLADGSVRNDSSDFISYPYNGLNVVLGDDLATNVAYKKTRHKEKDLFDYSASPAIRPTDFSSVNLTSIDYSGSGDWIDKSKNKNNATLYSTMAATKQYDHFQVGSGRRAEIQNNFSTAGKSEFSVETWIKFDSLPSLDTSKGYVWDQSPGSSGCSLRCSATGIWNLFVYPAPSGSGVLLVAGSTVQTGEWYHTVGVFDAVSDTVKLYINGEQDAGLSNAWGEVQTLAQSVPFTIGSSAETLGVAAGEAVFTTPGQYEFTLPNGLAELSAVLVGGGGGGSASTTNSNGVSGGGGGGGALSWINAVDVSGETTLYITVGSGGAGGSAPPNNDDATAGGDTYIRTGSHSGTIIARAGGGGKGEYNNPVVVQNGGTNYSGTYGGGGGNGGRGGRGQNGHQCGGGGGAGGYSGNGGSGSDGSESNATAGSGGGGGGAGGLNSTQNYLPTEGGGGVGIFGEGVSGQNGTSQSGTDAAAVFNSRGFSGSGGTSEDPTTTSREKGYGGGGTGNEDDGDNGAANGAGGAVRLVWGAGRAFPSTNVGKDETSGGPGAADTREYLEGDLGEFRFYDRVLTEQEILQNYNSNKAKYLGLPSKVNPSITNIIVDSSLKLNCDFGDPVVYCKDHNLFPYGRTPGDLWSGSKAMSTWTENTTEVTAPDSTFTATKWEFTGTDPYLYHQGTLTANKTYTMSMWVKAGTGMAGEVLQFRIGGAPYSTNANSTIPADGSWKRITFTKTIGASDETNVNIGFEPQYQGGVPSIGDVIYIWGAQLEEAPSASRIITTDRIAVPKPTYSVPKSISGYTGVPVNQAHDFALSTYENLTYDDDPGCFVFNGVDSSLYWSSNHIDTFPGLVAGFTLEAWINTNSFTTTAPPPGNQHSRIIGLGGTGLSGDMAVMPTGKLRGRGGGAQALEEALDPDAMNLNQWYHVVTTLSEERYVKIYRDGVLKDTYDHGVGNAVFNANPKAISIGRYVAGGNSMQYDGKIGEARAYARSLSAAEILNNFEVTRSRYGV